MTTEMEMKQTEKQEEEVKVTRVERKMAEVSKEELMRELGEMAKVKTLLRYQTPESKQDLEQMARWYIRGGWKRNCPEFSAYALALAEKLWVDIEDPAKETSSQLTKEQLYVTFETVVDDWEGYIQRWIAIRMQEEEATEIIKRGTVVTKQEDPSEQGSQAKPSNDGQPEKKSRRGAEMSFINSREPAPNARNMMPFVKAPDMVTFDGTMGDVWNFVLAMKTAAENSNLNLPRLKAYMSAGLKGRAISWNTELYGLNSVEEIMSSFITRFVGASDMREVIQDFGAEGMTSSKESLEDYLSRLELMAMGINTTCNYELLVDDRRIVRTFRRGIATHHDVLAQMLIASQPPTPIKVRRIIQEFKHTVAHGGLQKSLVMQVNDAGKEDKPAPTGEQEEPAWLGKIIAAVQMVPGHENKMSDSKCQMCDSSGHTAKECAMWGQPQRDNEMGTGMNGVYRPQMGNYGFAGQCYNCGQYGHRASECRYSRGGRGFQSRGGFSNRFGHGNRYNHFDRGYGNRFNDGYGRNTGNWGNRGNYNGGHGSGFRGPPGEPQQGWNRRGIAGEPDQQQRLALPPNNQGHGNINQVDHIRDEEAAMSDMESGFQDFRSCP
jgi:hypothetical protein